MKMFAMLALAAATLVFAGCSSSCGGCQAKKEKKCDQCKIKVIPVKEKKKSCDNCNLVYEDGTPADCCRTVTKFSH